MDRLCLSYPAAIGRFLPGLRSDSELLITFVTIPYRVLPVIWPQDGRHASDPQSAFDRLIERGHALSQRDQLSGF